MADIRYQFMAVGADGVAGSFRTIEQSAVRSKTAVEALFASMRGGAPKFNLGAMGGTEAYARRAGGEREVLASIRREEQERERSVRHVAGIKERYFLAEQRREEQQRQRYETQEAQAAARVAASRERSSWAGRLAKGAGRVGFEAAGGAAMAVTGATVMAARQAYQLEEAATRISINARQAGQEFIDPRVLRREFQDTAQASPGISAIDVADAVQQFITVTGDLDTARKSQKTFATVASATGSSVGDVAQAAAALSQQMGIKSEGQMKEVMAALIAQGKSGSFELRDAASLFPRLAAAGAGFGVEKSAEGVKTLGALTQVARSATGSGEQATTAVENIFTNLKMKSGKLQGMGVQVFNDNGTSRNIVDILTESVAKVGGKDLAKKQAGLQQIFGEQGGRAINPLVSTYIDTFTAQLKGGAKEQDAIAEATKAVRKKMTDFIDGAGDWKEVTKDAGRAQESATAKLTAAWEGLVAASSDDLVPALADFAKALPALMPAIAAVIQGFGLMAEGAAQFLDKLGLGKKETPYERENNANKALEAFDVGHGSAPLTPTEVAERSKLVRNVDRARAIAWQKPDEGITDFDAFNARLSDEARADIPLAKRKDLYTSVLNDPMKATSDMDQDFLGLVDPTSKKAIRDLADQTTASRMTNGAVQAPMPIDVAATNKALNELATAAGDAARGFSYAPQGDVLGG